MKYVKMLGLAAVAAAALMAFVGASTASATVLCRNNANTTTCSEKYAAGTEIHAVLDPGTGPAKLTTAFKNIECSKSTVSGSTSNEGSSTTTVQGTVAILTFEECNCEVNVIKKGELEIHWISGTDNGTLTSNGAEVTASCSTLFGNVHCIYTTENTDLGVATGGNPATMDIESANIPRLSTSALCAETAKWDAKYEVTSPKPLYVASS